MGIVGSSSRIRLSSQGSFFCPRCDSEMRYAEKSVETHFTILKMRLFPLGGASGFIECQTCKATYNHDVLGYDPRTDAAEFQANFEMAVLNAMVLMMLADGAVKRNEIDAIRNTHLRLTGRQLSQDEVQSLAKSISERGGKLADYVSSVARELNVEGKELVVKALYLVASADGSIAAQERRLLDEAASALDISKTRVEAVIAETRN